MVEVTLFRVWYFRVCRYNVHSHHLCMYWDMEGIFRHISFLWVNVHWSHEGIGGGRELIRHLHTPWRRLKMLSTTSYWMHLINCVQGGAFKNTYEHLNIIALKFSLVDKLHIFQCVVKILCVELQSTLWNSTQNILPIQWKILFFIQYWNSKSS